MLNLSIVPLNKDHIDERCEDIALQQKNGATTHAMFMMKFNPECNPPIDKASEECKIYDDYRKRLDSLGAKHGVLVQATLGHITQPREKYPFMPTVSLITGEENYATCCPMDPGFQSYIKNQMKTLAKHKPSMVMLDDDLGLVYRPQKGCACKYHMAEFNKRAGTNMSRQELYAHTVGASEEDKRYTSIYVETQKDGIVSAVKKMREGLDEVDPSIQGIVSGIYVQSFCEFSGDTAKAFAGKGNPSIIRLNGGPYSMDGPRGFSANNFRASILKENVKDKVDIFLAETDTCPQNRYSTSAALLHAHFTSSILLGAKGAKHWITRCGKNYEPSSGKAYRSILSKYSLFYEKLSEYADEINFFGCRIPLTLMQNYGFVPSSQTSKISPWSTCFLERMGLPLYFSNDKGGAVFLDDFSVDGFDDEEIKNFMSETLVLSAGAAQKLNKRGFKESVGACVRDWGDVVSNGELIGDNIEPALYEKKHLSLNSPKAEALSHTIRINPVNNETEKICPAVTRCENQYGGETIVFGGNPDMPYSYTTAFSLLNETRKKQLVDILSKGNHIPVYYPGDAEIYLRAGYLNNGEIMVSLFNIGLDVLDDITLVCQKDVKKVEKLNPDGSRSECSFVSENGEIRVLEKLGVLIPVVLFVS